MNECNSAERVWTGTEHACDSEMGLDPEQDFLSSPSGTCFIWYELIVGPAPGQRWSAAVLHWSIKRSLCWNIKSKQYFFFIIWPMINCPEYMIWICTKKKSDQLQNIMGVLLFFDSLTLFQIIHCLRLQVPLSSRDLSKCSAGPLRTHEVTPSVQLSCSKIHLFTYYCLGWIPLLTPQNKWDAVIQLT